MDVSIKVMLRYLPLLIILAVVTAVVLLAEPEPAGAQSATEYVYWSAFGSDKISRRLRDGTGNITTIASGSSENADGSRAIAVADGHVYWASDDSNKISRRAVDGSGSVTTIASGSSENLSAPYAIAVAGGYVYWSDDGVDKISRRAVDGSGSVTTIASGSSENVSTARTIAVAGGYVYWADPGVDKISRRAVDGSGSVATIASGSSENVSNPTAIAVAGGYVYWADPGVEKISRRAVDGTGSVATIASGSSENARYGSAITVADGYVYWGQAKTSFTNKISRRAVDGTGSVTTIASGTSENVRWVNAVEVYGGYVYWADSMANKISRRAVDGTGSVTTIASGNSENASGASALSLGPSLPSVSQVLGGNITAAGSMVLRWAAEAPDPSMPITGYDYRYKLSTETDYGSPVSLTQTDKFATITGLTAGSSYDFQVRAGTATQTGEWSPAARVPTTGPAQIITQNLSGNVRVSWTTPEGDVPDKYQVARQVLAPSESPMCPTDPGGYTEITTASTRPAASPYTDAAPTSNTRYCYVVRAQYHETDANLVGAYSPPALITLGTITIPPPEVTGASAEAASSRSLSVTWVRSAEAQLYRVQWKSGGENYDSTREQTALSPPLVIPDLMPDTAYTLRIRSEKGAANSAWSSDFTGTTNMASTPAQPNSLRLVDRDESSLSFTWNAATDADHPVTEWIINYRAVGTSAWTQLTAAPGQDGAPVEYTIPSLTPGVGYQVRVQGRNDIGLGGWSITRTFSTSMSALAESAPKDLTATLTAQTTSAVTVDLSWQPLASVASYRVTREHWPSGSDPAIAMLTATDTSYTDVVTVTDGVQGNIFYRVQGVDSGGNLSGRSNGADVSYFWAMQVPVPGGIAPATAGTPHPDPTIQEVRTNFRNAAEEIGNSGGFDTDGQGLLNFIVGASCMVLMASAVYTGQRFRQTPLAMGFAFGVSLLLMSAAVSFLAFPAIWLVLVSWMGLAIGIYAVYRLINLERISEAQGYIALTVIAVAAHGAMVIATNLAGYAYDGQGEYQGILSGTPLGQIFQAVTIPDSLIDIGGMFRSLWAVLQGLVGLMGFDYAVLDNTTGAAYWIASGIKLVAAVGQAVLCLFMVRSITGSGILNSRAAMIAVGVLGIASAVTSLS